MLMAVVVNADNARPGHNSKFVLNYGSGRTLCIDSNQIHRYQTSGDAINTSSARLAVYVLGPNGGTVRSASSTSSSTFISARWDTANKVSHGHRAASSLVN